MAITKGNVVTGTSSGRTALVIAVRKDGSAAKLADGDREFWLTTDRFTVTVAGEETCWKCNGSGLFYMGGAVVNGVFTGKTGPCFGCQGTGRQTNADRIRCHYYWSPKEV